MTDTPATPAPVEQGTPAPEPSPPVATPASDASTQTDWRAAIDDEKLKAHAERFNSPVDLVKAHLDLRQKLSSAPIPPGEGATEDEIKAYNQRLGIPDAPDGYEFKTFEGYEATDTDKAFQGEMAKAFHAAKLSRDQAAKLNDVFNGFARSQHEAAIQADKQFAEQSQAALRKEWGGDYDANVRYAARAAEEVLGKDYDSARALETKDGKFVLDHPIMLKMLASIGREMGEDRIGSVIGEDERGTTKEQIADLRKKRDQANGRGDHAMARKYDQDALALYKRLTNAPVVGTAGRTA